MERIVVVASQPEPDPTLLALVSAAFPECEIHIVFRGVESFEQCRADSFSGPFKTETIQRASWQRS
jgi:hypothetical protein